MEIDVKCIGAARERIGREGSIHIPRRFMRSLGLREGSVVVLWTEARRLVLVPASPRKRLRLEAEIVDELVEHEEGFEPEVA